MNQLCILIQTEQDPEKFDRYVRELIQVIEQTSQRIHTAVDKPETSA
ncbi:MAG TPA: hypothetical protein VGS78_02230 [Candidatus Sulfotelmatobacter sp.]|nr:hypothetical protein [Candidatus Sulfotelmatobacter sp.]